ncbi:uncharacterized protein LOC131312537 isoform X3 [Rhododendron vialii]|uniref:uncharacterized protein LOC131312537 isoform X3 n=1 Tax=Rhododendron vialii TaxID=182163 RepID=UPI00265F1482|nr:uncharacterized protein LOC131312537 isoform X3 [Rhododendron vialii]
MEMGASAAADVEQKEEDDTVCLDESFFINDDYQLTTFTFGSQVLQLLCLQSASTDFDLTGQLVWPGAMLLNNYLSANPELLRGRSVIELGSGVGITGILSRRFCNEAVLTDHNEEVLKILRKNIELHSSSENSNGSAGLIAEKLEWGNSDHLNQILESHSKGFDLVLGADIYILISSIPLLFDTVQQLLRIREGGHCKFLLAYVSRAKVMDTMVVSEAIRHGLQIIEVVGSRAVVGNLQGVIFEITLQ